ncbi:MAG TPA: 6-phosphogluconolactonase [Candidatus Saccharimonadales bacterium]|nr:6-phosphogluconolactonase [Candidatus Saccharimonadales bacterium]
MKLLQTNTEQELDDCLAQMTIAKLQQTIDEYGEAVWVLAGGNTPLSGYKLINTKFKTALDWHKVWFVIGDERHVELNSDMSNWWSIEINLLQGLNFDSEKLIKPKFSDDLNVMRTDYEEAIGRLPEIRKGLPRFDVVWLGIGEDGHTLSLFNNADLDSDELVVAVRNAPKDPSERISLTAAAFRQPSSVLVMASGASKAVVVRELIQGNSQLPIAEVVNIVEDNGGQVYLLSDKQALSFNKTSH